MAVRSHAGAQPRFDFEHALPGSLEAHGAAQLLRLTAGEIRRDHGDAQQLFLKQRDAERALQHTF